MNRVLRPAVRPLPGINCTVLEFWFWILSRFQMALFRVSIPFSRSFPSFCPSLKMLSIITYPIPTLSRPRPIQTLGILTSIRNQLLLPRPSRLFVWIFSARHRSVFFYNWHTFPFSDSLRSVSNISPRAFLFSVGQSPLRWRLRD